MKRSVPSHSETTPPYAALLEGSLQGVLIVSDDEVLLANGAAARCFGAESAAGLAGRTLGELFAVPSLERLHAAAAQSDGAGGAEGPGAAAEAGLLHGSTLAGDALTLEAAVLPVPWRSGTALQVTLLDRTAQVNAEADLAQTRAEFRHLIDGSLQGIYVHVDHRLLFVNRALADMFGYASPDELLAMGDALALYAPAERERLLGFYRARISGGMPPVRYEFEGLRKDGTTIWLENLVRVVQWRGRQAILATVVDISERKRAEQGLQASEEKYRDLVEGSMQALLIQREGRALFVNEALVRLLGYASAEELYALPSMGAVVAEDDRERMRAYARARAAGEPVPERYGVHAVRKDGGELWLDTIVRPVNWEGQAAWQVTLVDVTERVQAERDLQAHQRLLQTVLDTIPHSVYVKDADLRYRMVNRAFCEVLRMTAEEVVGKRLTELAYSDAAIREKVETTDREVITSGQPCELFDVPLRIPDGRLRRRHLIKYPLLGEHGQVEGLVGITEDITERLEAEEGLRASERLMRMVIDRLPFIVFVKDREGHYRLINAAFAAFHRLGDEQILGHTVAELPVGAEADRTTFIDTDRLVMESGEPLDVEQVELHPVGAEPALFHLQKLPLRDESGAIVGVVGLAENVTERVRAQEALLNSRHLLRTVIDTIPHAIFFKELDGRLQLVNRAYAEFYGMTPQECVGLLPLELPQTAEPPAVFSDSDRQVLETGRMAIVPQMILRRPGLPDSVRSMIKMPLSDTAGRIVGIVGITEDITERRQRDEELQSHRRLLQAVFDTIPTWLFVKDRESRFLMVNNQFAQDVGRTPEEFHGLSHSAAPQGTAEQRAAIRHDEERIVNEGAPLDAEEELTLPDGTHTLRHVRKVPLRDEKGEIVGLVGISEDITERKRVEEELRSNRLLLQTVFNLLPLWVFVKDAQRRFMMINRKMADDYGLAADVEPGALIDLSASITEEEKSVIYELDQRVLDTGELVEVPEVQITLPQGETRLFRTVRMPLRDGAGAVVGIVGISEDITERRRTEQAIQQAQKLESLGVLAGGIAHDFNNLLVSIMGNASLAMLDLPAESRALSPLSQIETAGQRAAELCRQMLAYSGKGSFEIASLNLNDLIEEMTQLLRVSLAKPIALNYDFDPQLPPVEVDPTQIRQVVMNLVMNAAEAIGDQPGSIRLSTHVVQADRDLLRGYIQGEALAEGRYVCLEVADTGEGIPGGMLDRIFDPFFTTKFTGRGLGLAAVLGIVSGHRGAMQVVSTPGEGSTFRMLLPAQDADAAAPAGAETAGGWLGEGTVLVVDDEQEVRHVVERMVASLGFEVAVAANGHEAVERVRELGDGLRAVLLDVTMPGLDGVETLRRLHEVHPELPVLLLSGYAEQDLRERFAGLRVGAYLQKPFLRRTLAAKLEAVLGAGR